MAKRKVEKRVLFSATESLLIEQGYHGFHFKALSERLKIGRSTLYEYYTSKEELVTDYFVHMLEAISEEVDAISEADPVTELKELLNILLRYSQLHQIVVVIPIIDSNHSPKVETSLTNLRKDFELLYEKMRTIIEAGKKEKQFRHDLKTEVIISMVLNVIQVPNRLEISEEVWREAVVGILFHGISKN